MTYFQTGIVFRIIILMPCVSFLTVSSATSGAQETVGVTEVTPELLVFATAAGNVVASVGPDGALLVGTPAAAAGWGRRGAFVAMHENALQRISGNVMGPPPPLPPRFTELGVDRPRIAFSEVLAFDINAESIHVVHQKPGYSNADAIVHFHVAKLIYLGMDGQIVRSALCRQEATW